MVEKLFLPTSICYSIDYFSERSALCKYVPACLFSYFGMVIILNLANFMGNQFASHFTDFKMECFFTEIKIF